MISNFSVTILGSGSALPTVKKRPTAQLVQFASKYYLIDCGEGTQVQLRKQKISLLKINHIFISHLHGDHYFGLVGLISSMHLLGRTKELHIYAPKELKAIIDIQLAASNSRLAYDIQYHALTSKETALIYDEKGLEIHTIPLKHKIYTNGFLFKEKPRGGKMKADKISYYNIPHYKINEIKMGADFVLPSGEVIPNKFLTFPALKSRSYAYCSDTTYREKIIPIIKEADVLYHEATFLENELPLAKKTFHSTVKQAASIAQQANVDRLLIGHFSARYQETDYPSFLTEGKEVFENITIANEGNTFEI